MRRGFFMSAILVLWLVPLAGPLTAAQRGGPPLAEPPRPAPRDVNGRVTLGWVNPADKGVWDPSIGTQVPLYPINGDIESSIEEIPFQPWARALYADRQEHELEPHARCKPSSVARPFETPYGAEIVEIPELEQIYIFDIGGPHSFRTIYMDGRSHPAPADLTPGYLGHSIGWWEGDTLVIDTVGFNEGTWMDRRGAPNSEKLHTVERLTRPSYSVLEYRVTVDDPEVYTRPWTGGFNMDWAEGVELFEYVCQQSNYASELMVSGFESVDRSATIVP